MNPGCNTVRSYLFLFRNIGFLQQHYYYSKLLNFANNIPVLITDYPNPKHQRTNAGVSNALCVPGQGLSQDIRWCPKVIISVPQSFCFTLDTLELCCNVVSFLHRMEITRCLDPGYSIRPRFSISTEQMLLLSKYLDRALSLPLNTFTGVTPWGTWAEWRLVYE